MTYEGTLVVETCWCGIRHSMPAELSREARRTGLTVYCPLGHAWVVKKTELDRAKEQTTKLLSELDQAHAEAAELRKLATREAAARKRAEKRAAAGACPCCNRSFVQLARHIKTKHPEFAA